MQSTIETFTNGIGAIAPSNVDLINLKSRELGDLSIGLAEAGKTMVLKAMEIGSLLIEKQSELKISEQRVWRKWMAENVEFSRFSAARYMKLARNGARVLHSLETGDAVSLRTALGLLAQDEKADSLAAGETE